MIQDGIKAENKPIRAFLMIGQSNMAGRGNVGEVPPIRNENCYMLRMGRWQQMSEPVNPDRGVFEGKYNSGVSLAASFADEVQKYSGAPIGLIPCADGGTCIEQWQQGGLLYDHAVMMTRLACRTATLAGIIWHQGESDCNTEEQLAAYPERFEKMITALRKELHAEELPLILGELSENMDPARGMEDRPVRFNKMLHKISETLPHCAVASSRALPMKPDGIHFTSLSCREFGKRYFAKYKELTK